MIGPGKYDDDCTRIREAHAARGVLLLVIGGDLGNGFSLQAPLELTLALPTVLRALADTIAADGPDAGRVEVPHG